MCDGKQSLVNSTAQMEMNSPPQKYSNEVVWYTFYSETEKRDYYYQPKTKTATWIVPPEPHRTVNRPPTKQEEAEEETQQSEKRSYVKEVEAEDEEDPPELSFTDLIYISCILGYRNFVRILTSPWVATAMLMLNFILLAMTIRAQGLSSFSANGHLSILGDVEIKHESVQMLVDSGLFPESASAFLSQLKALDMEAKDAKELSRIRASKAEEL